MGQEAEVFAKNGIVIDEWEEADAPARRRRWHDAGDGTHAVLLASASDVDDLIPTLVAFQIEWNKLRVRQRAAGWPPDHEPTPDECAEVLGGTAEDWARPARGVGRALRRAAGADRGAAHEPARADAGRHAGRLRAHDAALVDAGARRARRAGAGGPPALLRQLEHAQPREHRDRRGARARGRARQVRRARCPRTTSCARSSPPSARGAARARGRTSSTSSPGSTSTRTARRAAPRGGARRPSAASRTSAARPRCGCRRRSSRCRSCAASGWTRGSATWTPTRWRRPRA